MAAMKILIVEDEPKTGDYLKQGLVEAGFVVDLVRDGQDGLHHALTESYDLAILDVMLPGLDGWSVLQGIRKAGKDTPVLFLSARDHVDDRVKGLELGADDYLVKPCDLGELNARLRALLRRAGGQPAPVLAASGITLDPATHAVAFRGKPVELAAKEYALLLALMQQPGRALSRPQLEQHLYAWGDEIGSNAVEVYIHHLRRKLDAEAIRTLRGIGYVIAKDAPA